mgnify:CR=1 FL=1
MCNICCEETKSHVACNFCEAEACSSCTRRYLLDATNSNCMFCKKEWSKDFLYTVLPKSFINTDMKKNREKVLFEQEIAQLPATQPVVEQEIYKENQQRKLIELKELQIKINKEMVAVKHNIEYGHSKETKAAFIRKCPGGNCRGFLNEKWKCTLCESTYCKDCNELVTEGHVCDPSNVATVSLLKKDTKPCPSCGEMIFKIEGCNQMYCTSCHTAFGWISGTIEKGRIHNPHYFEWRRINGNNGREAGDFECGGLPDFTLIGKYDDISGSCKFTKIYTLVRNIQNSQIPHRQPRAVDNQKLRIDFMRNKITEQNFKKILQVQEKKREKDSEIYMILRMVSDIMSELLRQVNALLLSENKFHNVDDITETRGFREVWYDFDKTTKLAKLIGPTRDPSLWKKKYTNTQIENLYVEMEKLRTYANENFKKIGQRMNMKPPYIGERFNM